MLYQFLLNFVDGFGFLNVFKYITFRTGLSLFTSLIIVLLIGAPFINFFSKISKTSEKAFKAKENIENLKDKINKNPDDLDVMLEMAIALYGNGAISDSFDLLLKSIENDREWDEQAARKQLLDFFNTTGFEAKETILARRKLASLLFS